MYGRSPQGGYRLADKLRQEYRGRGENLRGIGAASTEELVARAQMGRDPRENVSEEAFSDRLRDRNFTYRKNSYTPYRDAAGSARTSGRESDRRRTGTRQSSAQHRPKDVHTPRDGDKVSSAGEVQVRSKGLSGAFLVTLAAVTMMIVTILFSVAQIYQTTNDIADLERQLADLEAAASELELAIEEKNDIRVIEQIATDQLGMVKEDSVQRKYISLSDGERIDLMGEEEVGTDGAFGTLLSSLVSALTGFFENLGS